MIKEMKAKGTKVVLYTGSRTATVKKLLKRFEKIGLDIPGPSKKQVDYSSALIDKRTGDLAAFAGALLGGSPEIDSNGLVRVYRGVFEAMATDSDALDAFSRDKGAINDSSLVTTFDVGAVKLLFTGDMQLEDPEVSDPRIDTEMAHLRDRLAAKGPYALAKLSHHGSYNGFSKGLWEQLGKPPLLGLCTGSESSHHPNPKVVQTLSAIEDDTTWVRTDRNGQVSITWKNGDPEIARARGKLNDKSLPAGDVEAQPPAVTRAPVVVPPVTPVRPAITRSSSNQSVEIRATIPHEATRVTIAVTVEPQGAREGGWSNDPSVRSDAGLAGGRQIPRLLFVTGRDALRRNIGTVEANDLLRVIEESGHRLYADVPDGVPAHQVAPFVRSELRADGGLAGVVLLGGYDVIPPELIDALPPRLRQSLVANDDPDNFMVLSDDCYGDRDGDGLPELPVSRVPDGRSADLTRTALLSPVTPAPTRGTGLRNFQRPFADEIFANLGNNGQASKMLTSRHTVYNQQPGYSLDGERIYIMLHGSDADASRFWGEDDDAYPTAMTLENVPRRNGMVAFSGCCWGAFVGARRDPNVDPRQLGSRTAESSIALKFLQNGALAFVGCTGAHYSPTIPPYGYYGGPMHAEFWSALDDGASPAQALFVAKAVYMRDMPHGRPPNSLGEAIEFKILRQYTCLGLGW